MEDTLAIIIGVLFWCFIFWRLWKFIRDREKAHVASYAAAKVAQSKRRVELVYYQGVQVAPIIDRQRRCEYCKQLAAKNDIHCSHCGAELPAIIERISPTAVIAR